MARNGSGVQSSPGADHPAVPSTLIESTKFNNVIADINSEITRSIAADGQTTITANLPMNGKRHTGIANAAARSDYASWGQAQDSDALWGGVAGGTADTLTLTLTPAITVYKAGQSFRFISGAAANTTAMTVAVNGLAVKDIKYKNAAITVGQLPANTAFEITYTGVHFELLSIPAVYPVSQANLQNQTFTAFTTTGTAPAFVLTPTPALTAYAANQRLSVTFHTAGTAANVNVSALGAKNLKQYDSAGAKVDAVITANFRALCEYDGTDFVVLNPLPATVAAAGANLVVQQNIVSRSWTARAAAEANSWLFVTWAESLSLFVAVSQTGINRVMTSPDGITWTARAAAEANQWYSVTWAESLSLFVAVSFDGTNRVMTTL